MDDFTRALMQLLAYLREREDHRLQEFRQMLGPPVFMDGISFERGRQSETVRLLIGAFGAGVVFTLGLVAAICVLVKALGGHLPI